MLRNTLTCQLIKLLTPQIEMSMYQIKENTKVPQQITFITALTI